MDRNEETPSPDAPVTQDPIWLNWHEPNAADLIDEFRAKRAAVDEDHPDARRWGLRGWNGSTRRSIGGPGVGAEDVKPPAGAPNRASPKGVS